MKKISLILIGLLMIGCSNVKNSSSNRLSSSISKVVESTSSSSSVISSASNSSIISSSTTNYSSSSSSDNKVSITSTSSIKDSTITSSSSQISSSTPNEEITTKVQNFYHKFEKENFNSSGGTTKINGLTFSYTSFTFLGGSVQGVQVGSKNNPQKTPWTLSTNFGEEVIITSVNIELANAANGSGVYTYKFGEYETSQNFSVPNSLTMFMLEDINVPATDFELTLKTNNVAMYFYSLSITCITALDSKLELTGDNYIAQPVVPGENSIPKTNYQLTDKEAYYSDINLEADKNVLLESLRTKISNMTKTSYGDAKTMLQYTDEHPTEKGYLYGSFDGDLIPAKWDQGASWNREHVWACAHMKINGDARPNESTKSHATDLHNLRVACQLANGKHGDLYYDDLTNSGGFFPNITSGLTGYHGYSGDFRGDTARILFYMYTRYEGLKLTSNINQIDSLSMGNLSTLLQWNILDPVDNFEIQRNNRIYEYQGNRNPFIDYSDLANVLFM